MVRGSRSSRPPDGGWSEYEVEIIPGLEEFAEQELTTRLGGSVRVIERSRGRMSIRIHRDARELNALRSVVAVYVVETFNVPRPKALLGQEHFTRMIRVIRKVMQLYPPRTFGSFRLSAAGADSPVFMRLKSELAKNLGIPSTAEQGDLLVTVRRPPKGQPVWQVLVRTSPRPLSARPWRVCNLPGALNATVAHTMIRMAAPSATERFLNLACGSGTLLIERLDLGPARQMVGTDVDEQALDCTRENLRASGHLSEVALFHSDATRLPVRAASIDTLVVDLPYGMLVGKAREIERLYPGVMTEATRVAVPSASFVVITAARKLFEGVLTQFERQWTCERIVPLQIPYQSGYINPRIYLLRRTTHHL